VVDDFSFEIGRAETYGLLGPNGAGKSTTISLVCGLLRRDAGEVVVAGHPLAGDARAAKGGAIGLVPQDIALYPDLTARENLTRPLPQGDHRAVRCRCAGHRVSAGGRRRVRELGVARGAAREI
jgi:ABC-type sugar transport system ATPase subunit